MRFTYQACDKSGKELTDTIEAPNIGSASEILHRKGLYPINLTEDAAQQTTSRHESALRFGYARRLKDLALFTRQLSVLVLSGTPLVEALEALHRQTKEGPWRNAIAQTRLRVEEGSSLAEAMEARSDYFDSVYCSLIAAGESSGNLVPMLERLSGFKQKELHVRNAIVGAMVYPCLLLFVAVSVLSLLLTFVVPKFAGLFESLDVPLPASTQMLVVVGSLAQSYWWAVLLALIGSVTVLKGWLATPAGRRARDTAALKVPQLGRITRSFATARIMRLLGVLLEGHVPVLEALRLARNAAGNIHYTELITRAEDLVSRGEPMYSAFTDTDLISPTVCGAIRSGEQSGKLGLLLLHVADFLDDENEIIIRSLTSIVEPVILILMGIVVGVVAISMFMPLFDLTSMTYGGGT